MHKCQRTGVPTCVLAFKKRQDTTSGGNQAFSPITTHSRLSFFYHRIIDALTASADKIRLECQRAFLVWLNTALNTHPVHEVPQFIYWRHWFKNRQKGKAIISHISEWLSQLKYKHVQFFSSLIMNNDTERSGTEHLFYFSVWHGTNPSVLVHGSYPSQGAICWSPYIEEDIHQENGGSQPQFMEGKCFPAKLWA